MPVEQEWSPEPWKVVGREATASEPWGVVDANGAIVVNARYGGNWEDFDRIAACVNACQGIPTEQLTNVINKGKGESQYPWVRERIHQCES